MERDLKRYIEKRLRRYPYDLAELKIYRDDTPQRRRTEEVCRAIGSALEGLQPAELRVIRLIYFDASHNVAGAALAVNYSEPWVYKTVGAFLHAVARELGEE